MCICIYPNIINQLVSVWHGSGGASPRTWGPCRPISVLLRLFQGCLLFCLEVVSTGNLLHSHWTWPRWNSEFSHETIVIFHSYVKLPEGFHHFSSGWNHLAEKSPMWQWWALWDVLFGNAGGSAAASCPACCKALPCTGISCGPGWLVQTAANGEIVSSWCQSVMFCATICISIEQS